MLSKNKSRDRWEDQKKKFTDWKKALHDVASEVRDIQTGLWFGLILALISLVIGFVYDISQIPNFVRFKIIPGVFVGLVGIYIGIVTSWATSVIKFKWLKSEWERTRMEAATLSEIGDISKKTFDYIIDKIYFLLKTLAKERLHHFKITFISPFNEDTLKESRMLVKLARDYNIKFEWNITEKTCDRVGLHEELLRFIDEYANTYLTGELPVFDKLIVIPNVTIIAFIENIWFCWNLIDTNFKIDEIKEKIILTPFSRKINQFFGKAEVHRAISCYLSEIVNIEGFMIGAEHSYLWIEEPKKLFERFTEYQKRLNSKFEEVSDELRPISYHITANLPLLDNYKAIINDFKVQEWLLELKEEAEKRKYIKKHKAVQISKLDVDRFIYIQGKIIDKNWKIEKSYLDDVCTFLREPFFSDLPSNYKIWIVLFDKDRMEEQYKEYKASATAKFPCEDIISNWIWFECGNGYHVLQYEKGLKVEEIVADALAKKEIEEKLANNQLLKEQANVAYVEAKSRLSKISVFMFADAVDPNSQEIMKKYQGYKMYLKHCLDTPLVLNLSKFLDNINSLTKNDAL